MNQVNYFISCPAINFKLEPERDFKLILDSSLPPVSCWREILKLLDGQHFVFLTKT